MRVTEGEVTGRNKERVRIFPRLSHTISDNAEVTPTTPIVLSAPSPRACRAVLARNLQSKMRGNLCLYRNRSRILAPCSQCRGGVSRTRGRSCRAGNVQRAVLPHLDTEEQKWKLVEGGDRAWGLDEREVVDDLPFASMWLCQNWIDFCAV
jgi:hypothetical protein